MGDLPGRKNKYRRRNLRKKENKRRESKGSDALDWMGAVSTQLDTLDERMEAYLETKSAAIRWRLDRQLANVTKAENADGSDGNTYAPISVTIKLGAPQHLAAWMAQVFQTAAKVESSTSKLVESSQRLLRHVDQLRAMVKSLSAQDDKATRAAEALCAEEEAEIQRYNEFLRSKWQSAARFNCILSLSRWRFPTYENNRGGTILSLRGWAGAAMAVRLAGSAYGRWRALGRRLAFRLLAEPVVGLPLPHVLMYSLLSSW